MADDIVNRLRTLMADLLYNPDCDDEGCGDCAWHQIGADAIAEIERLRAALLKYGTQSHYSCEDSWYSCPRSADGCCDDRQGDKCNCGADEHNAEVEAIAIQEARRG